jgi:DUF218 domain
VPTESAPAPAVVRRTRCPKGGPSDSRLIPSETTPYLQFQSPRRSYIAFFSLSIIALLLGGFGAGAWLGREDLLRDLTDLWVVSDPVTRGDAVVVLGGGLEYRPFIAADMYKKGLVSKVLVSQVPEGHVAALPGHTELNRKALLNLGVPDAAIQIFGTENRNTEDEVLALKDWAEQNAASVLIVPTEIFAARRVRWIFHRQFRGTSVRIEIPSFEEDFTRAGWRKTKAGLIAFQTEVLKYIYYRFKD